MDFGDGSGISDCVGHGTHVAGTIGGATWGVAKAVTVVPVKVFGCSDQTTYNNIISGINFVISDHRDHKGEPAVVNMSLGGPTSTVLDAAVQSMIDEGITVVVAAGNEAQPSCNVSPARVAGAITVAASTEIDDDANFSNYGPCNDLFAPGVNITSASYQSDSGSLLASGTSMATPHVVGAAALVLQADPSATPGQVWATIDTDTTKGVISECCGDPDKLLHVQALTVPGAPAVTSVTASDGSIMVALTPPTDAGGTPITGYTLQVRAGTTLVASKTSSQPSFAITGLTRAGVTYSVVATASNIVGQSAWTDPATVTLPDLPGAPTISNVTTASGSITVSLTAPATTSGTPITAYTVQVQSGAFIVATQTSTQTTISVSGLTPGAAYMVVAAASNIVGQSPWSAPTPITVPNAPEPPAAGPPGPPTITNVTKGEGSLTVTVTPSTDGGSPITGYKLQVRQGLGVVATQLSTQPVITVSGLPNELLYVDAASINIIGQSQWSASQSVPPSVPPSPPSPPSQPKSSFVGLAPGRLLDTRPGELTIDGQFAGNGLRESGSVTELIVASRAGVPDNAGSVVLNVTVTDTQQAGFVTVYPCGTPRPTASNLNFTTGQTVPNAVVAKVGSGGSVCLFTSAPTHLIADVNGYFPPGPSFGPLSPGRVLDTRPGTTTVDGQYAETGVRSAGTVTELTIAGRGGVPFDADAVVLNMTVTEAQQAGFITVFPCGAPLPLASSLNFTTGQTVPNAVIAKVGSGGRVCLYTSGSTHLIADVNGYFPAGSGYGSLSPERILDTRGAINQDGGWSGAGMVGSGTSTLVYPQLQPGVPHDAGSVVLNVTVTEATKPGFVTVYPCGKPRPNASSLNYVPGQTVPNMVIAKIEPGAAVCFYASGRTHLIVDVNGWM